MTITVRRTWKVDGVYTDPDSTPTLSNPTGTYGVKRNDTDAVVVADGTAMTKVSTGIYEYSFTEPTTDLSYTAYVEVVYNGQTYWLETDVSGSHASDSRVVTADDILSELGISVPTTAETNAVNSALIKSFAAVKRYLRYDPVQRQRTEFYPRQDFHSAAGRAIWEVNDSVAYARYESESATNELQLQCIPVRSIEYLYVDSAARSGTASGAFASSTLKAEGTDFWANYDILDSSGNKVCTDGILRASGLWPTTAGSVKVIYTAGYSSDELTGDDAVIDATPIWESILEESVRRARRTLLYQKGSLGLPAGILTSENLGDYSYSVDTSTVGRMFGGDLLPETVDRLSEFVNWGASLGN